MNESRPEQRTSSTITERQKNLVDQLPKYNWNYKQAALAVGYSKSYAEKRIKGIVRKNVELCRLIEDKRLEIVAGSEDLREKASRKLWEIVDNPNTTPTVCIRAIDTLGKMNGWYSNTLTLETPARQRELDAKHQEEVSRLLNAQFGITPMLPACDVNVYDTVPTDGDVSADNDVTKSDVCQDVSAPADPLTEKEENPPGDDLPLSPSADESRATLVNPELFLGMNI